MNFFHALLVFALGFWPLFFIHIGLSVLGNMRPFTSPKFPYEFGAKDNSISIDKKDYLLKKNQPVELDEEGKLKKRAIDYEIKMNKNFR